MRKQGAALRQVQAGGFESAAAVSLAGGSSPGSAGTEVAGRPPLPDFAPVPRKYRHDGWTPERQKAFIEALADCGSVTRAAAMVNMAQANCYTLRRAPGAEEFRRAWDAALDFRVKRLKDLAFERAVEGELVPVFVAGKLMGFRRKHNDALLMFCLRHYGEDAQGRRTTVNYFSTKAVAGANGPRPNPSPEGEGLAVAEASATTVRTVISGSGRAGRDLEGAAGVLGGFEGVALDAEAHAAIAAALEACAARARAAAAGDGLAAAEADPEVGFVRLAGGATAYAGTLVPGPAFEAPEPFLAHEMPWEHAGEEVPASWLETAEKLGMLVPAEEPEAKLPVARRGKSLKS